MDRRGIEKQSRKGKSRKVDGDFTRQNTWLISLFLGPKSSMSVDQQDKYRSIHCMMLFERGVDRGGLTP
jgi:hypothetical protein